MGRLIDAETMRQYVQAVCFANGMGKHSHVFSAKAIYDMIDDQVTVQAVRAEDAMSLEWLEKHYGMNKVIQYIIDDWKKEKGLNETD